MSSRSVAAELDYDGNRCRRAYARIIERCKAKIEDSRKMSLKAQQLKELEEKNNGENQNRGSVQDLDWETYYVDMQAAPTEADLFIKNYIINREKLKSKRKETLEFTYDNAATEADETAADLMKDNIARGEASEGGQGEKKDDGKKRKYDVKRNDE